jgi:signal transduction histidine kinase
MPRGSEVRSFCQDSSGNIWVGTAKRLLKFDSSSQKFFEVKIEESKSGKQIRTWIESITSSRDGTLWVGTDLNGLLHIDTEGKLIGQYTHEAPSTLCNNTVKCIYIQEDGLLWIGTVEGLNYFDAAKQQWLQFQEKDGLPDGTIYGILPYGKTTLWLSTNRGLSRMDITNPRHPKFRNYTPDDGLQSYEFNTKTYFKTRDGEMLFGGINGLNTFFPDSIIDNPNIPPIILTGFKKFDQPFSLGQAPETMRAITLDYNETVFSFEYAALEYTNSSRNQYAYMMEGFENEWNYCGNRREARYTNLSAGTYTFRVKGANNDGVWNERGIAVSVTIVPPFWHRLWFLSLVGLAVAGTFGATVRTISVRKLRREIEELERARALDRERQATRDSIARDLHDEVSSTLSSMSLFVESSKHRLPENQKDAEPMLDKLQTLARDAEDAMEQAVWSLSSHHDKLSDLVARIRDVASEECDNNNLTCEVNVSSLPEDFLVNEHVRKNIYLIFKESLTNTIKHAHARAFRVALECDAKEFRITMHDDGEGFVATQSTSKARGGNGLKNMNSRVDEIGATLRIQSGANEGTTVALAMEIARMRH